jgi:cytosine/adenosine deaminase-related metal-dependent hydrolase
MKYQSAKIMSPYDVLKLHTLGTAEVMGVENRVGSLKKGKYGDFLIVDPSSLDTGPVFDPYATLVFCCSIANLEGVYVGGKQVSRRGELLKHDFGKLQADVARRVASIRAKQKESLRKKLP